MFQDPSVRDTFLKGFSFEDTTVGDEITLDQSEHCAPYANKERKNG
jgi:hypothetical protein